jgi:hypothetical protein
MYDRKPVGLSVPYRKAARDEDDDIQDYKKPWVGLSIEDVQKILNDPRYQMKPMIVEAVEAKLKELNT